MTDFKRAQLDAMDDLRRNGQITKAARLVGLEILARVNRVKGCAYPAEEKIARDLGISSRTVRRAIGQLKAAGCIKITRRGRNNVYAPAFLDRIPDIISKTPDNLSCNDTPDNLSAIRPLTHGNSKTDIPKRGLRIPDNKDPLTLEPVLTLYRTPSQKRARSLALRTRFARAPREQQKAENEIAEALGWECFTAIPTAEAEDLRKRWPNVGETELLELKRKYPT